MQKEEPKIEEVKEEVVEEPKAAQEQPEKAVDAEDEK